MRILLIGSGDRRARFRFLMEPLERGGHEVSLVGDRSFFRLLIDLIKIRLLVDRPDAIISVGVGPKAIVAFILARLARIPFIIRLGGNPLKDSAVRLRDGLEVLDAHLILRALVVNLSSRLLFRVVKNIIVVTDSLANNLSPYLRPAVKISVVPQFVGECTGFRPHCIQEVPVFLTVTNFNYKSKSDGVIWLIECMSKYSLEVGREAIFRIAGAGMHFKNVKKRIDLLENTGKIHIDLLGYVEDIEKEYIKADFFLYNSFHDCLPNVILEAGKFGLPIIVNKSVEFEGIVEHKSTGMLYSNCSELRNAIEVLISDDCLRDKMIHNSSYKLRRVFSVTAVQRRLDEMLREFVGDDVF